MLEATVRIKRLRWFGYVQRIQLRLLKSLASTTPVQFFDEKRKRGLKHTFWSNVQCTQTLWDDICLMATDRKQWNIARCRCACYSKDYGLRSKTEFHYVYRLTGTDRHNAL